MGFNPDDWRARTLEQPTPGDVRATRTRLGLTQTELGRLLGTHMMSVSKAERGVSPLPSVAVRWFQLLRNARQIGAKARSFLRNDTDAPLAWLEICRENFQV